MKKLVTLALLCLSGSMAFAQQSGIYLTDGAVFNTTNGATIYTDSLIIANGATINANDGTFDLDGTLYNEGTFNAGTSTVVIDGTMNQRVYNGPSASTALYNLEVNKIADEDTINIDGVVSVTNMLTITDGMIFTSMDDTLWLTGAAASLTGEQNEKYVRGNLAVKRTVSGSGDINMGNTGITIDPTGENLGEVTIVRSAGFSEAGVSYATGDGSEKSIDRIWHIESDSTFNSIQLTLEWLAANDNGLSDFDAAQVWKSIDNRATWFTVGDEQNASTRSITVTATGFSDWTVSTSSSPLPITLLRFGVQRKGEKDVLVDWATTYEKEVDYFAVERSNDGENFEEVGQVGPRGGNTTTNYEFLDKDPCARGNCEILYYRLRSVDNDGTVSYSPTGTVHFDAEEFTIVAAYPNPFMETFTVSVMSPEQDVVNVELIDELGRTLYNQQKGVYKGQNRIEVTEIASLPAAVYFLRISNSEKSVMKKLIKNN